MTYFRRGSGDALPDGVYERLVDEALHAVLGAVEASGRKVHVSDVSGDLLAAHLARVVHDAVLLAVRALPERERAEQATGLGTRLLELLSRETCAVALAETRLRAELLESIWTSRIGSGTNRPQAPRDSLAGTKLLVNRPDENVLTSLVSEFATADRVDLLCAFVKRSGVRKILEPLRAFLHSGRTLRLLTTTYLGATDAAALDALAALGAEIRVSYDESTTRLHAKAWLFHRRSGFHTAYVGSSNLSHTAMTDGLEWNVRLTAVDAPQAIERFADVFDSYWDDAAAGFEPHEPRRVRAALARAGGGVSHDLGPRYELEPKPHQQRMLDALVRARAAGRTRNLVVAATGTGKTLLAAFDFDRLRRAGSATSLLFVAHRDEILEQSRRAFRDVAGIEGELLTGEKKPSQDRYLFATNLTLRGLLARGALRADAWDYVVVDEVHHAAAGTYEALLEHLRPRNLVGLTATPERADGRSIERHFDLPAAAALRLWDAIDDQLLVPFSYFSVDDEALGDLRTAWKRGQYDEGELTSRILSAKEIWIDQIVRALKRHLVDTGSMRALAFCVGRVHAKYVAERLTAHGIPATAITHGDTSTAERAEAIAALRSDRPDRPRVLCAVDVFNEGVDIPEIDTVLMLRPTDSATVFLQQLGRGLRKSRGKDSLTVLDFVAQQHERFRLDRRYAAALGLGRAELRAAVRDGFPFLPAGCVVQLTERTRDQVLAAIRNSVGSDRRRLLEALREAGPDATLSGFLDGFDLAPRDLYADGRTFCGLRRELGWESRRLEDGEADALREVPRLVHADDTRRLSCWSRLAADPFAPPADEADRRLARMLFGILYGIQSADDLDAAVLRWSDHDVLRDEVSALLSALRTGSELLPIAFDAGPAVPLSLHAAYLTEELAAAFDVRGAPGRLYVPQSGVVRLDGRDLLLVTIDKSGKSRSPHLQYEDRALTPTEFHWQSQAATTRASDHGQRHVRHRELGVVPQLFVREHGKDGRGLGAAYRWLGPVEHVRDDGERPISIVWRLAQPMPDRLYRNLRPAA